MENIKKDFEILLIEHDPSIKELSEVFADIIKEHYGSHNYKHFKKILNEKLK